MSDKAIPNFRMTDEEIDSIPLIYALIPIVVLIGLLILNVNKLTYGDSATLGANQLALLVSAGVAGIIGWILGVPYAEMLRCAKSSIDSAMGAILILLMIGAVAGTWMISGVVPAMIYYGLQILNPTIFLVAAAAICAIVSVATGSSWTTVATVGVALLGIGGALGVSAPMTGGAIISGAYFGDKISPLSDTTNLAAAMAGTDLITHIKYMLWTTVPSISIALVIYLVLGFNQEAGATVDQAEVLATAIQDKFNLNPLIFLVPIITIAMVAFKVDAIVALFVGALLGGIFAIIFQPAIVNEIGNGPNYAYRSYTAVVNAMIDQINITSDNESVASLLSAKGMIGMLNTIWLVICSMCFGGVMEACGLLKRITRPLVKLAQSTGSLVATTVGTCLFFNMTASDQYLAIVVPGRMFRETYRERGLAPQNLSRTLEDSGTVTSVLIPWNTCGAAQSAALGGMLTWAYAPYCFFNIISPFMSILVAYLGIRIAKLALKNGDDGFDHSADTLKS
jgi:NhaC family Na+:H+ antiporter